MKPENIKIISSKVDRETKEGKIVIEVEEVPQSVNLLAKFFLKERSESDPDSGKLEEMDDYFMQVYQKNTGNSFSFARLKAIEAVLIKYGYLLAKEENHEFEWTEELVIMYAEAYRYSSSRISIKQFKEILSTDNKWHTTLRASAKEIFEIWAAKGMPDEVVYRTVKASDRLPDYKEMVFLKNYFKNLKHCFIKRYKSGVDGSNVGVFDEDDNLVAGFRPDHPDLKEIEWLEPIQLKDLSAK